MLPLRLAAIVVCSVLWTTVAAQPTAKPVTQTTMPPGPPVYRMYPLRNGTYKIAGNHAFHKGDPAETYDFALYVWLILGGEKPMLVDAGLSDINQMNRGAAHVLREPIIQDEQESLPHSFVNLVLHPAT
ncbi:MAG: hypothetical protein NTX52_15115 [Planctomycetota bacterium]|nr:hypothetical protein [Planctomycetota bacterium]